MQPAHTLLSLTHASANSPAVWRIDDDAGSLIYGRQVTLYGQMSRLKQINRRRVSTQSGIINRFLSDIAFYHFRSRVKTFKKFNEKLSNNQLSVFNRRYCMEIV